MEILLLTALLVLSADGGQTRPVQPGQNVTLTGPDCSANDSVTLKRRGSDQYVYYCIDGHAIRPNQQDPSFVGRVEGTACPLKSGIVSVVVMNPTREDDGEYEWSWKNSSGTFPSTVYLKVTGGDDAYGGTTSGSPTPVGIIVGVVFGIVMIITLYLCGSRFKRRRIPCRLGDQQNSELPATYSEVQQQQV